MRTSKALTLIEVIAVLIIVSILVVVAIPNYQRTVEQARDKEAISCLRLIQAGEKIYRSRVGYFYPYSSAVTLPTDYNPNLNLDLNEQTWDYSMWWVPGGRFFARANRQVSVPPGFNRRWLIMDVDCNPTFGAVCIEIDPGSCPVGSTAITCP